MRLVRKPQVSFDDGITLTFKLPISAREELKPTLESISEFSVENDYILTFSKARKSRSLDANAYMWVLCDKIAKVIKSTKEEVYRRAIKEVGVFSDVAVQEGEPCATLVSSWGSNGIGYFSEVFDSTLTDSHGGKMKRVRLYEGSHHYDSVSMARVIDWVVEEAKSLNIEVMSDTQIKELEASWKH